MNVFKYLIMILLFFVTYLLAVYGIYMRFIYSCPDCPVCGECIEPNIFYLPFITWALILSLLTIFATVVINKIRDKL